jgi:hypothetical protein
VASGTLQVQIVISAEALASLQQVAKLGMTTPVAIQRQSVIEGPEGDDVSVYTPLATVYGWLSSRTSPVITVVGGVEALVNTYRLYLPVGTDISSGDQAIIEGSTFTVSDTTAESTLQPMLEVSLRRAE